MTCKGKFEIRKKKTIYGTVIKDGFISMAGLESCSDRYKKGKEEQRKQIYIFEHLSGASP